MGSFTFLMKIEILCFILFSANNIFFVRMWQSYTYTSVFLWISAYLLKLKRLVRFYHLLTDAVHRYVLWFEPVRSSAKFIAYARKKSFISDKQGFANLLFASRHGMNSGVTSITRQFLSIALPLREKYWFFWNASMNLITIEPLSALSYFMYFSCCFMFPNLELLCLL